MQSFILQGLTQDFPGQSPVGVQVTFAIWPELSFWLIASWSITVWIPISPLDCPVGKTEEDSKVGCSPSKENARHHALLECLFIPSTCRSTVQKSPGFLDPPRTMCTNKRNVSLWNLKLPRKPLFSRTKLHLPRGGSRHANIVYGFFPQICRCSRISLIWSSWYRYDHGPFFYGVAGITDGRHMSLHSLYIFERNVFGKQRKKRTG